MSLADVDLEHAVVAACLFKPELFPAVSEHVKAEDFSDSGLRSVFTAVSELHVEGVTPDSFTVSNKTDALTEKLPALKAARFTPSNIGEYAKKVRKLSQSRQLEQTFQSVLSEVTSDADPSQLAATAMERLLHLSSAGTQRSLLSHADMREIYIQNLHEEAAILKQGEEPGIRFGFRAVDKYTHGLRPEDLMILAADPGMGKTSVAMSLLRRRALQEAAKPKPEGSGFISLEMGRLPTGMRNAQMIGQLTTRELRSGMEDDRIKYLNDRWAAEEHIPLWNLYGVGMSSSQLKAHIAYMVRKFNVNLFVIDHFGYISIDGRFQSENSLDEARITFIKDEICLALGVSVILICHTNKAAASREDKKPRMSDLAGSQKISARADYIALMYRPWEYLTEAERNEPTCPYQYSDAFLIWVKNRNERKADAVFHFEGATMTIEDSTYKLTGERAPIPVSSQDAQEQIDYEHPEVF